MNPAGMSDSQGYGGQPEVDPGSMGQMDLSYGAYSGGGGTSREGYGVDSFDEEQPLLKELGIDLELIKQKVRIIVCVCCVLSCDLFYKKPT